jgi:CrcB protein
MAAIMNPVILVMSGGAIGAGLRYGLSRALPMSEGGWPWPTFAANVLGGLAMGVLAAWILRGDNSAEPLRLFVGVGVLGGFTTFSAFSLEMARMIERGQTGLAAGYALASVLLALGALFAGMTAAKAIWA